MAKFLFLNLFATATQRNNFESLASRLDYVKGNVWDQIQQDDPYLINRHPGVVKHVKLLYRKTKPSAVKLIQPIVCQHEDEKPDQ
jgi:hypothetical protein